MDNSPLTDVKLLMLLAVLIALGVWLRKLKRRKVIMFFEGSGFSNIEWRGAVILGRLNGLNFKIEPIWCGRNSYMTWITAPISYKGPTLSLSPFFFNNYPEWNEISLDLGRGEPLKPEEIKILKSVFEQPFQMFEIENGPIGKLFPKIELNIENGQFNVRYSDYPKKNIAILIKLLGVIKNNLDKIESAVQQLTRQGCAE